MLNSGPSRALTFLGDYGKISRSRQEVIPIIAASPGLNLNLTICTVRGHEFGLQKFLVFLDDVGRRG